VSTETPVQFPVQHDGRFERLIKDKDPVIDQTKPGKEELRIRTFVVETYPAVVRFPKDGVAFRHFPQTETTPEYHHSQVGGTHVHLTEGLTPDQLTGPVKVELRLRCVEPTADRKDRRRNYEFVVRLSPTTDAPTKRVSVKVYNRTDITVIGRSQMEDDDADIRIHKGGLIRITEFKQPRGDRPDRTHASERTDRERGNRGGRNEGFRW
jgi:hypothetical protein